MMGDMGDFWRDVKEHGRKQKQKYRSGKGHALQVLEDSGLEWEQLSHEHYRIDGAYDWWPSTGHWRELHGNKTGFQIRSLIKHIKSKAEAE